jgi:hypothetical protein
MPAKLEKIQQTSRQPKIVSRRVSVASPTFTAPDMGKVGKLSTQKFSLPFPGTGRDFSALTRGLGIGAPQIKFFGIRAEGEKFIFIIDASADMYAEEIGGLPVCEYVKEQVMQTVEQMSASVLFNAVLYDGEKISMFSPQMVPVTGANRAALQEWIAPTLSDPSNPGLPEEQNNYQPEKPYETAMGDDASGWLRSIQASFEQRPDTVFIVSPGWGVHRISREKGQRLLDFSLWELLSSGGAQSVKGSEALREDRELRDDLLKQAVEAIDDQEKLRDLAGDPQKFLHDLLDYIQYSEKQILDHADAVAQAQYTPYQLAPPRVNFVRLMPEKGMAAAADTDTTHLRELVRRYSGELKLVNGTDVLERQVASCGTEDSSDSDEQVENADGPEASDVNFLGVDLEGGKIAFLLDASVDMVNEKSGGTNAYAFIKDQLLKTVDTMSTGTLFNVIAYDGHKVGLFRPEMTSVPDEDLTDWLAGLDSTVDYPGLSDDQNNYVPPQIYETAISSDVSGLPLALQAAMEQGAESIVVVSTGMGHLPVGREKARRLLDFSIWDALGASASTTGTTEEENEDEEGDSTIETVSSSGGSSSGGLLTPLKQDRQQRTALIRLALQRIAAEKKEREAAGLPLGFVHDILDYIEYTPAQALDHLKTVGDINYALADGEDPALPEINVVCLLQGPGKPARETMRDLRGVLDTFGGGNPKFLRGADSDEKIRKLNRLIELHP